MIHNSRVTHTCVVQCVAACCSVVVLVLRGISVCNTTLTCDSCVRVAVWCSVLQCVAVCCSVVQCFAVWCRVVQSVGLSLC